MSDITKIANKFIRKLAQIEAVDKHLADEITKKMSVALGGDMTHRIQFLQLQVAGGKVFVKFKIAPNVRKNPSFQRALAAVAHGETLANFVLKLAKDAAGVKDGQGVELVD